MKVTTVSPVSICKTKNEPIVKIINEQKGAIFLQKCQIFL